MRSFKPSSLRRGLRELPDVQERLNRRRIKQGRVASNKMDKTIVVVAETRVPHPVYGKIVRKSARFKAHDERNEANIGDVVRIAESRPFSREKRWRLVEIVEKAR
ncbi:MAG: 30S ribosomal protein S17 [Candidatus Eremiobacteraeota bacterium]|nr:30S ribosomal protein S17 [Candidatus Eremiobacteraeota bacterium]MBV9972224.1 30S ribosomal protein S17 [Candidatus Eremiobacteraeota bacterium]